MANYIRDMMEGCADITGTADSPAHSLISPLLGDRDRERFHSTAAQLLYLSKRVRPDLLVAVSFLTKRVLGPQQDDWNKLKRAIQYLRKTCHMGMVLEGGEIVSILAYV